MRSIKIVFKIGQGPSSSHTVGPFAAAKLIKKRYPEATNYKVILYGSLAMTGGGHGTMNAIKKVLPSIEIELNKDTKDLPHPNTMDFFAYKDGNEIGKLRILSVGGGIIEVCGEEHPLDKNIYSQNNFSEVLDYCKKHNITIPEFVYMHEDEKIKKYLMKMWKAMEECIERGLSCEGVLPGGLEITRKAKMLYDAKIDNESNDIKMNRIISAFSYAACEENASEGLVVTAPTCGSCGVIPSVMYFYKKTKGYTDEQIIDALAVCALVGDVIITNASVSGAECGCQAEIGSACSMAAAGLAHLFGLNLDQIEYAAEVAMEHNLGLTCDPVKGLVQIPCIERNAVAAMRAINSVNLSLFLYKTRRISFDSVIETMYRTGLDMNDKYRETSNGGLAVIYKEK